MNQILITQKLYVTPELRRKKKIYKFNFIFSIFLVLILISLCIYAEYDRNRSEEVSQEILSSLGDMSKDQTVADKDLLVVILSDNEDVENNVPNINQNSEKVIQTTESGYQYTVSASINIPKIGVNYPILEGVTDSVEETEALLKNSPVKFWGPNINEVGNYCIVGHNYRNSLFFSKVPTLQSGDIIEIIELSGKTTTYKVYDKYTVAPDDVSCTTQLTNGRKEVTLITCTNDSKQRVVVKTREVK